MQEAMLKARNWFQVPEHKENLIDQNFARKMHVIWLLPEKFHLVSVSCEIYFLLSKY